MYFWVLDLWPESLQAAGNINNKYILGFFTWVTKLMYRHSDKILMSSNGFRKSILEKGDFEDKLVYFPNWAEDIFDNASECAVPELPEGFKVMFAGNIGEAQDFESVMKAAQLLKGTEVRLIIIGDGRKKEWIDHFVEENQLKDVVYMMGRYPLECMPSFFSQADVLFLSLKDDYIFSLTTPAKLQAYMASGKPVLAMIDGDARQTIIDSNCGMSCASGDYKAFAECVLKLKDMPRIELDTLGINGRLCFEKHFRMEKCIDDLCTLIIKNNDTE
jgi:glycosyltransferase involved in cell wall biosynthesis